MDIPIRPPPKGLLVDDGTDFEAHLRHLISAGNGVNDTATDTWQLSLTK